MKNNNNGKTLLIYLLVSVAIICGLVYMLTSMSTKSSDKKYSEIMEQFDSLNVSQFELDLGSGQLKYKLKGEDRVYSYTVPNVSLFANEVLGGEDAENYRKKYNTENPDDPLQYNLIPISDNSFWLNLIPTLLMLGVMIFFFVFMMKNAGGGKMSSFGKTNAKMAPSSKKATFDDVAGADEEKEELKEIVDFLRDNKKYTEIGARIPKGVLLLGPPGTGKTLLARAVAGEAKVPFFSISGSDFVEMFVGVGASRVRDLFEQAKKNAPAIIFIDEIDAVGRQRGAGLGGGHDEREQTLNQLLVEMDGFEDNDSVIVMAATNRRDILDPALLRPGRFDRQILVGYPDVKGREAILKVHTRNKPLAPDVDLETIAKSTVGFTGADLENLVNEASLLAARKNKKAITKDELEEASIKVVAGPEKKSKVITEDEKKLTAYHEGGHALCTYYSKSQDKVHQVSIIPRGQAGGFTMSLPVKDKSYVSKNEMYENIVVLLGGRVAEKLILDDISTGASNDLERATSTARNMVTRYGFSDNLGPVVYGQGDHEVFLGRDYTNTPSYSDNVAAEIDNEIRTLIESAFTDAEKILNEHMDKLHVVAKYLMKYEKVDGATFEKLMNGELTESEFMGEADKTPEIQDTPEIVDDISVDDN
ncbi:ATP-dependent zinc metalloprotease FtsH [Ruminococcus sp. AF17-6LB]|uniref:ATP-dependent zinc metalloprotease FtsH n=1 Tax=unclassified Ruminococcus TaxID=2608920 RepID=UPI000E4767D4|nr:MULTISPECIES: ATP-dependent zinc metalloprotease FtsH [unclassified Ruminococcus]RGG69246.1 ATP-dependent zinc metalloprotease FtsH [Ruminococcus sp. AF17-6LB]RGG70399.1 ATP-dependent zinc metalloprotease FtsH [Ruminococcus sp. AF17-6]RGG70986.1 ATP-dependent zinc metalloprotease FtsH [Ruminococcus sp. AF17-24]RGG78321.1 ATP-dependent zinc metalloprotease FtsH [Ruminococcus sp. AF17-1AC]